MIEETLLLGPPSLPEGEKKVTYHLSVFKSAEPDERFPLLVALHGRGDESASYLEIWKREADRHRVMILAPRTEEVTLERLDQMIGEVTERHPIDRGRMFLAGVSLGALRARQILVNRPSLWKAVILIASPDSQDWIEELEAGRFPPLLFAQGARDEQYPWEKILRQAEILKKKGVKTKVLLDSTAGHEHKPEWNRDIFEWIQNEAGVSL